jgi:hypothetical protein
MLQVYINTDNYSREMEDYLDKTVTHTLLAADKLYIGYRKPINSIFVGMDTANTNTSQVDVKYYNGSSFVTTGAIDRTYGLSEQGFISWDRGLDSEAETEINGSTMYWYELTVDVNATEIIFSGINLLLSDDKHLQGYESQINNGKWYPGSMTSFIGYHQGARNEIIQHLRNQGKGTYDGVEFRDLTVFDLLDATQLQVASTYLALSKIFFNYSDRPDDKYFQKYMGYTGNYEAAMNVFFLSVDSNDDGKVDTSEAPGIQYKLIKRI